MPGHLVRGHKAAGRYRLEAELGRGERCTVWRAVDETLERQVALRFFDPSADRHQLVEQAGVAASLTHPRVVRLFDTGFDTGQFFTVSELLAGSLDWASLPMPADEALRMGAQVAEALVYAHQRGVAHGAIGRGNVLFGEQGAKLSDFALTGRALDGIPARPKQDLVQLGELLYLALTGRHRTDVAAAGRPLPDEPKGLAKLVLGLAEGAYEDARKALADLHALSPAAPAPRRRGGPLVAAAAAVLTLVAALGVTRLGDRPRASPEPSGVPRVTGTPYKIATVADWDPLGDGREGHRTVAKIADGDAQTFWSTERYSSSPFFSGRKPGVGVILDLGSERAVAKARVLLAAPGCSFEIRSSPVRSRRPEDWAVNATLREAGTNAAAVFPVARSRWWLVWVTKLTRGVPGATAAWACGVADVSLYPP